MATFVTVITAVIMSGILTTIFNTIFSRQKVTAETEKIQTETDAGCVGTLLSIIRPLKEELEDLQEQITNVKAANEKLARQVEDLQNVNETLRAKNTVLNASLAKIKSIVSSHANRLRLEAVLEAVPVSVLVETDDRHIAAVNTQFLQMFQIDATVNEMVGFDCTNALQNLAHIIDDVPGFSLHVDNLIQESIPQYNIPILLTDGTMLHQTFIPLENGERLWVYQTV